MHYLIASDPADSCLKMNNCIKNMLFLAFTHPQIKCTRWPDQDLYHRNAMVVVPLLSTGVAKINQKN